MAEILKVKEFVNLSFKNYSKWFKNKFNCLPTDFYALVLIISELIAMRKESPNDRYLDIITFEEWKQNQ